jgi:circadian clock protein KaiB
MILDSAVGRIARACEATPMRKTKTETTEREFGKAAGKANEEKYFLRLYIAGMTPKSSRAIANLKKICEEDLKGRCELEVIDIYQQPQLARGEQIIATPTLIKKLPLPLRKLIGDISDKEKFLVALDLAPKRS